MKSLLTERRTILLVEDNSADAQLVADTLADAPNPPAVVVARGGREALARLRDPEVLPQPDLLLLDLNLPGVSGLQTLTELKADPRLRHIPVLVLTTSKSQDEINGCYELGAAAVLNKPLRLHDHRAMIGALASFWLGHVRFAERG